MSTDKPSGNRKSGTSRPQNSERGEKPAPGARKRFVRTKGTDDRKPFNSEDKPKRSYDKKENSRYSDTGRDKPAYGARPIGGDSSKSNDKSKRSKRVHGARPDMGTGDKFKIKKRQAGDSPDKFFAKPERPKAERLPKDHDTREFKRFANEDKPKRNYDKPVRRAEVAKDDSKKANANIHKQEVMPLNKYVSHCGICSRREAVELVKEGKVKVNDEVKLEPGYKVQLTDKVEYAGKIITSKRNLVYILLNKPKNFITTTDDPLERKTVMDLIADSGEERVYPVGRLDRNTTGLLLLTNDGELAQKLSHPKYNIKKVYQVTLNKNLTKPDYEKIMSGLTLEDGEVMVDALAYLESKNEIGIEIHSGRNRIVRRIFESLGYVVEKLDRVMYAGLTKKNIPRSKWRFLNEKEIINLKHFKPQ